MNPSVVWYILGNYMVFFSLSLLLPLGISFLHQEKAMPPIFLGVAISTALLGGLLALLFRKKGKVPRITKKEGILIVSLSWIFTGIIGGLPYYLSGEIPSFISAVFESVSGFTTTGSSVLTDIEKLPNSLLFWRALTHFLGGLGIVVLFVAILPYLGVGGRVLFKSEATGPEAEPWTPKARETAMVLFKIYITFTLVETLMLFLCGMPLEESVVHTFATLATGGFSPKNASIGHYQDLKIELLITLFMFMAGTNFYLYYHFFKEDRKIFWKDEEFRVYLGIILLSILVLTVYLTFHYREDFLANLRETSFTVVSLQTCTGFVTADYEKWPSFCQWTLISLMFVGGCAGSTSGGIKVVRWIIVFKYIVSRMSHTIHPYSVDSVKINKKPLDPEVVQNVLSLFILWFLIFGIATTILCGIGMDIISSTSATITTMSGVGPGLGEVGPMDNFSAIPPSGQVVLIVCMLFGRLEIYTLLILCMPLFWKK